jgi:hypothetical protein
VGGPNERLEPISASNRVNFDLLAEYNVAAPMDLNLRAEGKHEDEKPSAAGEIAGKRAPTPRPAPTPLGFGQQPVRTPYTGPVPNRPVQNPKAKPNPGGMR